MGFGGESHWRKESIQKTLTFFRVFDLAFFVPGSVLLAALVYALVPVSFWSEPIGSARGLLLATLGVVGAFSLGLWAHAVYWIYLRRIVLRRKPCNEADAEEPPADVPRRPLPDCFAEPTRTDLLLYFWYLRATCWNLAFAAFVVGALFSCLAPSIAPFIRFIVATGSLVFAWPLVKLGNRLNDLIEGSLRRPAPQPSRENDP